jgi:hypothetical protein
LKQRYTSKRRAMSISVPLSLEFAEGF